LDGARQGDIEADRQARRLLIDVGAQAFLLAAGRVQQLRATEALQKCGGGGPARSQLLTMVQLAFPALKGNSEG
jgi:hypothetical protein